MKSKIFWAAIALFAVVFVSGNYSWAEYTPSITTMRVAINDERAYYIRATNSGVNSNKVEAPTSRNPVTNIIERNLEVTDVFPEGLEFKGFVPSADGTFGGFQQNNNSIACGGILVDDTKEASISEGTWNTDHSEYYYHGIHYYPSTRQIKYTIKGLQAGCRIDVGVVFKAPSSVDDPDTEEIETRRDFINNIQFRTDSGLEYGDLIDIQMYGEYESAPRNYYLRYQYDTATVPSDVSLKNLPSPTIGAQDQIVDVAPDQVYEGYKFHWTTKNDSNPITEDRKVKLTQATTYIYGVFEEYQEGETEVLPDKYTVHYEVDNAPAWYMAPSDRKYTAGQTVPVDKTADSIRSALYSFDGWTSDDVDLSTDDSAFDMPSRDVTLRGNFDDIKFTVTYEFDGDILPPNANELLPEPQQYQPGDIINTPSDPTANDYLFTGWYIDEGFRMPEQDITIKGRWRQADGVFAPELKIGLSGDSDTFEKDETAKFKITVKNTAEYDLTNVLVKELLDGAIFVSGEGYEAESEFALIDNLPSGPTITLNAEYPLQSNDSGTITNTVDLISATGRDNYALDNRDYRVSIDFKVADETLPNNTNTGDAIFIFAATASACCTVIIVIQKLTGGRRINTRAKRALIAVAIIMGGSASIIYISKAMNTYSDGGQSITGVYEVTSETRWIDYATARTTIRLKSDIEKNQKASDVLYLVNNSRGMTDSMDLTKEKLNGALMNLMESGNNRAAVMTFNTKTELLSDFTNDTAVISNAINSIETESHTDMAAAFNGVRDFLASYEHQTNRNVIVVLVSAITPDYGENSGSIAYYYLKRDYPFVDIAAVQYQMYPGRVLAAYSDRQYFANEEEVIEKYGMEDQDEYGFAIKRAQNFPTIFDELKITDLIDTNNFKITGVTSTFGNIDYDDGLVEWDLAGAESGSSVKAQITVKLKDSAIGAEASSYHLSEPISGNFRIGNKSGSETLGEGVDIHGFSTVTYDKYPTSSVVIGEPGLPEPTRYLAYTAVPIVKATLYSRYVDFVGLAPEGEDLIYVGKDYFVMDDNDVTVRPVWKRVKVTSATDGKTYKATRSSMWANETNFNQKAMKLIGATENPSNSAFRYTDETIKHFKRGAELPEDFVPNTTNTITYNSDSNPVYIWVEGDTLYYYTASPGKVYINNSPYRAFIGFKGLIDIEGVSEWDTSKVVRFNETFSWCNSLEDFSPLADWDTSRLESISNMFSSTKVSNLNFMENWNFSKLTSLDTAFQSTRSLTNIDALSRIDTSNMTSLHYVFQGSGFADTTPLASWNVSNVKDFKNLFSSMKTLRKLDGLANWNTSSATDMSSMFFDDCQFESLEPLRNWDVSNVTNMSNMFYCNPGNQPNTITTLEPIYGWQVQSTTNKSNMFKNINLTLPNWY
jgi:surface protein